MAGVGRLLVGPGALRPRAKDQPASPLAVRPRLAPAQPCRAEQGRGQQFGLHRQGEIRDRTFENQSFRASGLSLITAAIVHWNSVYLDRAVRQLAFLPMARFAAGDRLGSARREAMAATIARKLGIAAIRSGAFLRAEFAGTNWKRPTAFVASSGDRVILEGGRAMRAAGREEGWQRRRQ